MPRDELAPYHADLSPAPNNLFAALRVSHEIQRSLCLRLVRAKASQPAQRQALFQALKIELAAHEAAEERFLYAPILMDDHGLDASRHALSEHHQMDEMVEAMGELALDGEAWGEHAKELAHKVRHHLKEEEHRFFQVSGKILSETQIRTLAKRYERDYQRMLKKLAAG